MGASVTADDIAFADDRYEVLAQLAGLADADHARGKMMRLWRTCTMRQSYVLPDLMVRAVVDPQAVLDAELGERVEGGIRIRGTKKRIGWYGDYTDTESKVRGGKARAAKAPRHGGRFTSTPAGAGVLVEPAPSADGIHSSPEGDSDQHHQHTTSTPPAGAGEPDQQPTSSPPAATSASPSSKKSKSARPSSASPSPTPIVRTPSDHVRAHVGGADPPRDAYQAAADELWHEQEQAKADLRAAGVDPQSRGLGMVHPAKGELVRRIADQAANGRGLEVAIADCRHVLAVLIAEAKVTRVLRWIDGGHWEPKRFAQLLSQSPGLAVHRAREKRDAGAPGSSPPPERVVTKPLPDPPSDPPTPEQMAEIYRHMGIAVPAAGSG